MKRPLRHKRSCARSPVWALVLAPVLGACVQSEVVELTESTFNATVNLGMHDTWFVKFYAPWCGHCKRLSPIWDRLAVELAGSVRVAKVDATAEETLAEQWDVYSYPDLKLFIEGEVFEYTSGDRSLDALVAFARGGFANQTETPEKKPSAAQELRLADFERWAGSAPDSPWFLKFYAPWCTHCQSMAAAWEDLAYSLKGEIRVGSVDATVQTEVAEAWGVTSFPTLKFLVDGTVYDYRGARTADAMAAFARGGYRSAGSSQADAPRLKHSDVVRLGEDNFMPLIVETREAFFVAFILPSCGACKSLMPDWERLAAQLKNETRVGKVNVAEERNLTEMWGVGRFPTLLLFRDGKVFAYDGDRDIDSMRRFALEGYKSAPVRLELPQTRANGQLHLVVGFAGGAATAMIIYLVCQYFIGFGQALPASTAAKSAPSSKKEA